MLADRGVSGRVMVGISGLTQYSPPAMDHLTCADFSSGQMASIVPADYTVVNSLCVYSPSFKQSGISLLEVY